MTRTHDTTKAIVVGFRQELETSVEELLPPGATAASVIELGAMEKAARILDSNSGVRLLIACLQSADLRDLYHVQIIRQQYDHVTVVVLFDVSSERDMARRTALGLLSEFLQDACGSGAHHAGHTDVPGPAWSVPPQKSPEAQGYRLTPRQHDVLYLVREGKSNKEIARRLDLSEGTVKIHCMAIFRELGVANRTQAAILAEKFALEPPIVAASRPRYVDMRMHVG